MKKDKLVTVGFSIPEWFKKEIDDFIDKKNTKAMQEKKVGKLNKTTLFMNAIKSFMEANK